MANTPKPIKLQSRSKPSSFFCKFFIIVLVLLTIPLFPSQAPEFTTFSTFFTKLWEPLQLLFVGLAICYGLFCKRSSTTKLELKNNEASDLDFYGFLDMSSFFEDGFQNSCGYDEKRYKLDEGKGVRSLNFENGCKKKDVLIGKKVTHGWNSKYFRRESMVVVANGDCVVDDWGEPVSKREYKSLNLPVRSLRSNIVVADKYEENETTEGGFSLDASIKVRGVRPMNLEKEFDEVSSPAPGSGQTRSSHLRPHSAGEFDFDLVEPESDQYQLSRSTHSKSTSLGELSPSSMEMEDMDPDIDLKSSHMKVSVPRIASEGMFMASKSRHSNFGHSLDMTLQGSNKERFKETNRIAKEVNFNGGKQGGSYAISEAKSDRISRELSRGKSVRTIRSCKVVPYEMRGSNTEESNAGNVYVHTQDSSFLDLEGHENPEVQKKPTINDDYPVPVMEFPESLSEDKDDCFETSSITSRDNSESESESYSSSPDEEVARSDIEESEVDRKAGEFIAKFREQIRLQKLASAKKRSHSEVI